jgi:hypothetical protein
MLEAALSKHGPIAGRTPAQLGTDIVAVFAAIDAFPDKVQWVHREIARRLGQDQDPALDQACRAMASMIDADPASFDRNPYHNRQHYCEVALTAYFLCELGAASACDTQLILVAALIHDVVHDGKSHPPFYLERASVDRATTLLAAHGVGSAVRDRIAVLVLSTDPSLGTRFVAATRAFHRGKGPAPAVPDAAPELASLVGDGHLAAMSTLLCEADILPSVGLTARHAMRLQSRLAREWNVTLGPQDKLDFIETVLAGGLVSEFFLPNVIALRSALIDRPDDHAAV